MSGERITNVQARILTLIKKSGDLELSNLTRKLNNVGLKGNERLKAVSALVDAQWIESEYRTLPGMQRGTTYYKLTVHGQKAYKRLQSGKIETYEPQGEVIKE